MSCKTSVLIMVLVCMQTFNYVAGESFYVGITRNLNGATENFRVHIFTSSSDSIGYIIESATETIATGSVSKGQPMTHELDTDYSAVTSSYTDRSKGLRIYTADDDNSISVLVINQAASSFSIGDYNAIPYKEYDVSEYKYFTISTGTKTHASSLVFLVGNVDDTTITIIPKQDIIIPQDVQNQSSISITVSAGEAHTFTLHQLQTITILSSEDLTGSSIASDKPLTVVGGHECGNVPSDADFCEHLTVQIPPTVTWGKEYLLSPYQGRTGGQYYRIVAAEEETVISNSCTEGNNETLDEAGDWNEFSTSSTKYCYVKADKPIALFQLATGFDSSTLNGDPAISLITPVAQYDTAMRTFYVPNYSQLRLHYINIVSVQETTVLLDDSSTSVTWNEIRDDTGNTVGYGTSLEITEAGAHDIAAFDNFYLLVYGWGDYTSYSYTFSGQSSDQSESIVSIDPFFGSSLGGSSVVVQGLIFNPEDDMVQCAFDGILVNATVVQANTGVVVCLSPFLTRSGYVPVEFFKNGQIYNSSAQFYSVPVGEDPHVKIVTNKAYYIPGDSIEIQWTSESLLLPDVGPTNADDLLVDIILYKFDDQASGTTVVSNVAQAIKNTGKHNFTIESTNNDNLVDVVSIRIKAIISEELTFSNSKWTDIILVDSDESPSWIKCQDWAANQQSSGRELSEIVRNAACPPTSRRADLPNSGLKLDNTFVSRLNPDAEKCYTQKTITEGLTNQCCYGTNGALITGPPSGGVINTVSIDGTLQNKIGHYREDILPKEWCCKGKITTNRCDILYEKRGSAVVLNGSRNKKRSLSIRQGGPPGGGNNNNNNNNNNNGVSRPTFPFRFSFSFVIVFIFIFSFAFFFGDPHVLTLDLYQYTFNGKGEFTLIETNDTLLTLQGRMIAALGEGDSDTAATVFSAFVAKQKDSAAIQFELITGDDGNVDFVALADGNRLNFDVIKSQRFKNVIVSDLGNNTLEATFNDGAFITLQESNGFISMFTVSLPITYQGLTRGLLGNYNGDTSDDFLPKNGINPIPINSSNQDIHEKFGITWIISDPEESLFTYSSSEDWSTFYSPDFVPEYEPTFDDPALQQSAEQTCGENRQCLFDVATTGRIEVGQSSQQVSNQIEETMQLSQLVSCDPECMNGACVDTDTCQCSQGYEGDICDTIVYEECVENPCNNSGVCRNHAGSYICTCVSGYTGLFCDDSLPITEDDDDDIPTGAIIGGVIGGLIAVGVIVAIAILILIAKFCCTSGKSKPVKKDDSTELNVKA